MFRVPLLVFAWELGQGARVPIWERGLPEAATLALISQLESKFSRVVVQSE